MAGKIGEMTEKRSLEMAQNRQFYLSLGSMNTEWFYNFFNYVRVEMNLPPKKTQNLRVKLKSQNYRTVQIQTYFKSVNQSKLHIIKQKQGVQQMIKKVIVDTTAAPALYIVGQQYSWSLCSLCSLKYTYYDIDFHTCSTQQVRQKQETQGSIH